MTLDSHAKDDSDQIMHQVREEVAPEKASQAQIAEGVPAQSAPPPQVSGGGVASSVGGPFGSPGNRVEDFLLSDDEAFLENAYRRILNREIDPRDRELFLAKLKSKKLSKLELLARLGYSPEGRANGVPIRGWLAVRGPAQAIFRIPVLGYLLMLLNYLIKLPKVVANQEQTREGLWIAINEKVDNRAFGVASEQLWGAINNNKGAINNNKIDNERLNERLAGLESEQTKLLRSHQDQIRSHQDQKRTLLDSQRRLNLLLEEARKRLPEPFDQEQVTALTTLGDHWLDAHYVSFEDVFRGTREEIKQRVESYLKLIHSVGAGTEDHPVIDLGCGRGELLELLKDNDLVAYGIDLNQVLIKECQDKGFEVIEADAIEYLRKLPQASVGAITGLHIIEHLPFNRLVSLLDECLRVLKPGGFVAFETPNPENLRVGAYYFYFDPTHLHPLPPLMSQFLLEARGYVSVEIMRLEHHPVKPLPLSSAETSDAQSLNQLIEVFNSSFAVAPDYAVIGYKA